jgi:nucleoside-diphosphate-sugar epimerase
MTILVTGGAGFVGINVIQALLERREKVVLFDSGALPESAVRALLGDEGRVLVERASVLHIEDVRDAIRKHGITHIIHAAAVTSGTAREAREPMSVVDVNLRGTLSVLEAARDCGVRRVVYVGSGAAYGESLYRLGRLYETTPSIPTTLYSISKHAAERLCMRMRELWDTDIRCVRLGTVIGPWERDTGARDNFGTHSQLAAIAIAGGAAVLPPGEVQRDWVYARDVAEGLIALAYASAPRHVVYNLSSGVEWQAPIQRWCEVLKAVYPAFTYRTAVAGEQPGVWYTDRDRGIMDIGRIAHDLGFSVRYPMEVAYEAYLGWLRDNPGFFAKKNPGSRPGETGEG